MSHLEIPLNTDSDSFGGHQHHLTLVHFPVTNHKYTLMVERIMRTLTGGGQEVEFANGDLDVEENELLAPTDAVFGESKYFGWRDKKAVRLVHSAQIAEIQELIMTPLKKLKVRYSNKHTTPHVTYPLDAWTKDTPVPLTPVIRFIVNKQVKACYPLKIVGEV